MITNSFNVSGLFNVTGINDLEGMTFARCTSLERAEVAKSLLEKKGFENMLEIVEDEMPVDAIEIDGELIELL